MKCLWEITFYLFDRQLDQKIRIVILLQKSLKRIFSCIDFYVYFSIINKRIVKIKFGISKVKKLKCALIIWYLKCNKLNAKYVRLKSNPKICANTDIFKYNILKLLKIY